MTVVDFPSVEEALDAQVRPLLRIHGGGIAVVSVSAAGDIELEFEGACRACALKTVTYSIAVRQRLRELPGVRDVTVRGVNLSHTALDRVAAAYSAHPLMIAGPSQGMEDPL
jgi:Fe-S cluster biogenesis protein NfuA